MQVDDEKDKLWGSFSCMLFNPAMKSTSTPVRGVAKIYLYVTKILALIFVIVQGFYLVFRHSLYKDPNNPHNTRYVQYICKRLCHIFNLDVKIHGEIPRQPALWVSNHISWLDIAVLGASARVFFLAKAEIEQWPVIGKLAKGGGTLFIQRGSGDSLRIREQMTQFLQAEIPVLFFPEATTTDGQRIKKIHGRLLGAAIEAGRPVQMCVLCYVNQAGQLDQITPYINNIPLTTHMKKIIEMPKVNVHLMALPAIEVTGHTVDSLTKAVQVAMTEGLAQLHQQVLSAT